MTDGVRHASQDSSDSHRIERRARPRGGRRKEDSKPDSAPDRFLAYFSYLVLVFTAACIFMPVQTENALSYVRHAVAANAKMTTAPVLPAQWNMRGSMG